MTDLEKQQASEILRLRSLCRYAASELRALDNIISLRHPCSSGLSVDFMDILEEKRSGSYIEKYDDLKRENEKIVMSPGSQETEPSEEFEDLVV